MHWRRVCNALEGDKMEIMIDAEADEFIEELFESLLSRY